MKPPDVSYARSGEVAIAYQVGGDGQTDIVFVRGITGDLVFDPGPDKWHLFALVPG